MLIGPHYFVLEIEKSEELLEEDDPEFYLYETSGAVLDMHENGRRPTAGRFTVYYVDVCAALNAGADVYDVFDVHATTLDFFDVIFNPATLQLQNRLVDLFDGEEVWGNVLIIDRLEILPRYRGMNLGLVVMRRLIERFGAGCAIVAIKPFPLQFESVGDGIDSWREKLKLSKLNADSESATLRLCHHYEELGFRALHGTPFMFRLSSAPLPLPADLAVR